MENTNTTQEIILLKTLLLFKTFQIQKKQDLSLYFEWELYKNLCQQIYLWFFFHFSLSSIFGRQLEVKADF
jgi:hypothetical protein